MASGLITIVAMGMAGIGVRTGVRGWDHFATYIARDKGGVSLIPERLWQVSVATSAAVLLIAGFATLLFNVARSYHQGYLCHVREMEGTRRIEAAVRVTMSCSKIQETDLRQAFTNLAERLIAPTRTGIEGDTGSDLSATPEIFKAVKELVVAIGDLKSPAKKG